MKVLAVVLGAVFLLLVLYVVLRRRALAEISRERLTSPPQPEELAEPLDQQNFLRRWLYLAGFRRPAAPAATPR